MYRLYILNTQQTQKTSPNFTIVIDFMLLYTLILFEENILIKNFPTSKTNKLLWCYFKLCVQFSHIFALIPR